MGLACETNKYQVLFIGGARASSRTSNRTEKTSYDGDSGPCS